MTSRSIGTGLAGPSYPVGMPPMGDRASAIRRDLASAVTSAPDARTAADLLCGACVRVLDVDGAAISLVIDGTSRGTFGSSDATSRRLDELQFTLGEGPCLEAVSLGAPVLAGELLSASELRWPAFRDAVVGAGVVAVFALPVAVASTVAGALDLYRRRPGPLAAPQLAGGLFAARLATLPLLGLLTEVDWATAVEGDDGWEQLASLDRIEVYQATGMLIGLLEVSAIDALARLRAYAFSHGMTASEVAYAIVDGRLPLDGEDWRSDGHP